MMNEETMVADATAELVVSQVYVLPETIQTTDTVTLGAEARNDGGAESGAFTVRFTLDGETRDVEFPSIAPNASHWEEVPHAALNAGEHSLSVELDVGNQVNEGNKYDNTASIRFQVNDDAISEIADGLANGGFALSGTDFADNDAFLSAADSFNLFGSVPAPLITRVGNTALITVYFGHDNFVLDAANLGAVEALGEQIHFMVNPEVTVDGYASSEGDAGHNLELSKMRREAVIALLTHANKDAQFSGSAHGESDLAEAETGKGTELEAHRAQNRRVTIFITGLAEPDQPKPPDLTPHPKDPTEEEILEDRLNRALKQSSKATDSGQDKTSVINKLWEKVDDIVDDVTGKFTDNKKIRDTIQDGVHKAIEKGSEELFDQALDQTSLGKSTKDAIKAGVKAGLDLKF